MGLCRAIRSQVRIPLRRLDELAPGRDPALDTVLEGLIEGRPIFVDRDAAERRFECRVARNRNAFEGHVVARPEQHHSLDYIRTGFPVLDLGMR